MSVAIKKPKLLTNIRWCIRRDMPEVLSVETATGGDWDEADFLTAMRRRNCIVIVAEVGGDEAAAFAVYELHKDHIQLVKLAVHPAWQRFGVGTTLLRKLLGKLDTHKRPVLRAEVCETNLGAQLWLRQNGVRAERVVRGVPGEPDVIEFVGYAHGGAA